MITNKELVIEIEDLKLRMKKNGIEIRRISSTLPAAEFISNNKKSI